MSTHLLATSACYPIDKAMWVGVGHCRAAKERKHCLLSTLHRAHCLRREVCRCDKLTIWKKKTQGEHWIFPNIREFGLDISLLCDLE